MLNMHILLLCTPAACMDESSYSSSTAPNAKNSQNNAQMEGRSLGDTPLNPRRAACCSSKCSQTSSTPQHQVMLAADSGCLPLWGSRTV